MLQIGWECVEEKSLQSFPKWLALKLISFILTLIIWGGGGQSGQKKLFNAYNLKIYCLKCLKGCSIPLLHRMETE